MVCHWNCSDQCIWQFENCLAGSRFQTSIYHKAFRKDREKIMKCNVVCIQTYPKMNQKEENLFHMETLLRKAMESHPDTQLIIFPELAVTGYQCGKNFKDLAETATINSTSVKKMSALAKEFHVHIVYGMAEKEEDILYNSQFFIDDTGCSSWNLSQSFLFVPEKNYFTPGDQFKVFNTKIGRIGLFICY